MQTIPRLLSAARAASLIERGELTSERLVRSCLERIECREPELRAWAYIDPGAAIAAARRADAAPRAGLLHGIPVGFKDVVDTRDMPTAYGSPIYSSHWPGVDAACVAASRRAGMVPIGKTASTEFAYRHPSRCANPHRLTHSPGGSSSGSAAAVADSMVPLAMGTQTAGSVIRPAAYCGVHALKPGFGELSYGGVRHLAESFDTLGFMARSIEDLALFGSVLQWVDYRPVGDGMDTAPTLAVYRSGFWEQAQPDARRHFDEALAILGRLGASLTEIRLPDLDARLLEASSVMTKFEGARLLMHEWQRQRDLLSPAAVRLVEEGCAIGLDAYHAARECIEHGRSILGDRLAGFDGVLALPAAGEAPGDPGDTGPVIFNFLWTVAHLPALNLPLFTGDTGLPLGLQLVGARGEEHRLLCVGRWIERHLQ